MLSYYIHSIAYNNSVCLQHGINDAPRSHTRIPPVLTPTAPSATTPAREHLSAVAGGDAAYIIILRSPIRADTLPIQIKHNGNNNQGTGTADCEKECARGGAVTKNGTAAMTVRNIAA